MELKIGEKWLITSDAYNWILQEYALLTNKRDKKQREGWRDHGYFPKLEHALQRVLQEELKQLDETNVHMIIDTIKQTEKNILKAVADSKLQSKRGEKSEKSKED